eukprot:8365655-Alexandrium_andersonii.AAC.1
MSRGAERVPLRDGRSMHAIAIGGDPRPCLAGLGGSQLLVDFQPRGGGFRTSTQPQGSKAQ